jgi:predicted unusual protein kinase regulating ubiquinone biosynthesis (AarF/ABC1/UbiB family)
MSGKRRLPTGRLGRMARLAALGARAGTGKLAGLVGDRQAAEQAVAEAAADALGALRGLAMKAGQMASYVDGAVPAEHRDTYESAMKQLRDAAPTMTPEAAAGVLDAELEDRDVFAHFEPEPFASASIGQVHRATLHDGREVAVKVQFEGIEKAVRSDLGNASVMTMLLGPLGTRFGVGDHLDEVKARLLEELDYRHEASRQQQFAALFVDHPTIRIPTVVEAASTRRVLTTTFAPGHKFDAVADADEDERRAWAETLWRFVFGSIFEEGLFNADPHPGNYLFEPGGVVHFLDFGCTRQLPEGRAASIVNLHRLAIAGDQERFADAALELFGMQGDPAAVALARQYVIKCFEPVASQGRYRLTRDFAGSLLEGMRDGAWQLLKDGDTITPLPAEWVFFNRLQLGFYSVLARLDVEVDYQRLDASLLPE